METNKHKVPDSEQLTDEEICALMDSAEAARNKEDHTEAEGHILLAYDTLDYRMPGAASSAASKVEKDQKKKSSRFDPAKQYRFSRSFARRKGVGVDAAILIQFLSEFSMSEGFRSPSTNLSFIPIAGEELADFLSWKSERTWQLVLHDIVHKGLIVSTQEFRKITSIEPSPIRSRARPKRLLYVIPSASTLAKRAVTECARQSYLNSCVLRQRRFQPTTKNLSAAR